MIINFLLSDAATASVLPTARGDPDAERTASAQRGQSLGLFLNKTNELGCKLVMGDNTFSIMGAMMQYQYRFTLWHAICFFFFNGCGQKYCVLPLISDQYNPICM